MTIFVVAYPLVGHSDDQAIKKFRRHHDQAKADLIEPHFTLVFAITTFSYEDVLAHTRHLAVEFQPFEVLLNRLVPFADQFTGEHKLFLCASKGERQLVNLHNRFYEGRFITAMQIEEDFEPHMTIATARTVEQLAETQAASAAFKLPIYSSIDALSVIQIEDRGIVRMTEVAL